MSPRQRQEPPASTLPAPLIVKLELAGPLSVKLVEPEKKPPSPNSRLRWLIALVILSAAALSFLWGAYVVPRTYPPATDIPGMPALSVALIHPTYIALGDEAEIEVTVTNRGSDPITGTVTVVFTGTVAARPALSETTTLRFDDLAGGASLTRRIKFIIAQPPIFWSQDKIGVTLQATLGSQRASPVTVSQIALAPLPYLNKLITILLNSAVVTSVVAFLWNEIKKHILGEEGR